MCGSSPSIPPPPPPPPPPPEPPKKADEAVKKAKRQAEAKARNLQGDRSTQLTGVKGLLAPVNTGKVTVLGGGRR